MQVKKPKIEKGITSQPVASERLLIRIKGVLPMAARIPFFDFFFLLFFDELQRRSQKKYATARESKMAVPAPTAPALLAATGAIFRHRQVCALGLLLVKSNWGVSICTLELCFRELLFCFLYFFPFKF